MNERYNGGVGRCPERYRQGEDESMVMQPGTILEIISNKMDRPRPQFRFIGLDIVAAVPGSEIFSLQRLTG